jgi:D-sedoheptulose 7-phosphate isomerase
MSKKKIIRFPITSKKIAPKNYFKGYFKTLEKVQNEIDLKKIEKIYKILSSVIKKNNQIFVAGNGGSASVSNHFLCDFNKGIKISSKKKLLPKVISLSNSIETITAIANDINYDEIFSFQLENYIKKNDCLFLFSSSGKSKNILNAINFCKNKKIKVIFVTGFLDKEINKKYKIDVHLDLNCKNYGITEDIFSSLMHMIVQSIRFSYQKNSVL